MTSTKVKHHHCHWPGCPQEVPPKMWGCARHWFALPKHFRDRICKYYRPGQEITKDPSEEYIKVAMEVQAWCRGENEATRLRQLEAEK